MTEAFVSSLFVPGIRNRNFQRVGTLPLTTPRRARRWITPLCARSLESYMEGKSFDGGEENRKRKDQSSSSRQKPPSQKLTLQSAMIKMKIASIETCAFLLKNGRVSVNGETVTFEKTKIDRFNDRISVNDTDYGTLEEQESGRLVGGFVTKDGKEAADDAQLLPRVQKDFKLRDDLPSKKMKRSVDGGFFSGRRRRSAK